MEEFVEKFVFNYKVYLDSFTIISYVPLFGEDESQRIKTTAMERYRQEQYVKLATDKINNYIQKKCIHIT